VRVCELLAILYVSLSCANEELTNIRKFNRDWLASRAGPRKRTSDDSSSYTNQAEWWSPLAGRLPGHSGVGHAN
jgi:hypothetical protein